MEVAYTALINKPAIKKAKHFGSYRNFIGKSKQNEEKVLWKLSEVHWKMIHLVSYRNLIGKGRQNEEKVLWKSPELHWKRKAKRRKSALEVTGTSLAKEGKTRKKYFGSDRKLFGKNKQNDEKVFCKFCKPKQVYKKGLIYL